MLTFLVVLIILSIFGAYYNMRSQEAVDALWRKAREENAAKARAAYEAKQKGAKWLPPVNKI